MAVRVDEAGQQRHTIQIYNLGAIALMGTGDLLGAANTQDQSVFDGNRIGCWLVRVHGDYYCIGENGIGLLRQCWQCQKGQRYGCA